MSLEPRSGLFRSCINYLSQQHRRDNGGRSMELMIFFVMCGVPISLNSRFRFLVGGLRFDNQVRATVNILPAGMRFPSSISRSTKFLLRRRQRFADVSQPLCLCLSLALPLFHARDTSKLSLSLRLLHPAERTASVFVLKSPSPLSSHVFCCGKPFC